MERVIYKYNWITTESKLIFYPTFSDAIHLHMIRVWLQPTA